MAEVAMPARLHRHTGSISQIETGTLLRSAPRIEMIPNPDFSFPALPASGAPQPPGSRGHRRPQSMHGGLQPSQPTTLAHRRAGSALPSFSFNAGDATGLKDASTPPLTPSEQTPQTPSSAYKGHRRGGSEFVGGDSRLGVEGAITSSPTKANAPSLDIPGPAIRHRHRRSGAQSSHDVSQIMLPPASRDEPRQSSSLPTTPSGPAETPPPFERAITEPSPSMTIVESHASSDVSLDKPIARPKVGFADNVEFIPRPLSTISSETEGSMSTRGHSVNNSISSVLSPSSSSPPPKRLARLSLSTTFEDDGQARRRSSAEISKRIEKEGEWLMGRASQSLKRPLSEPRLSFAASEPPNRQKNAYPKKHSISHTLGFDRRKSEPAISLKSQEAEQLGELQTKSPRPSTSHLASLSSTHGMDRRPSTRRIRNWAFAKLSKKTREKSTSNELHPDAVQSTNASELCVPGQVDVSEIPAAETDLDAVFGGDVQLDAHAASLQTRIEISQANPVLMSRSFHEQYDGESAVVDLDAALGPNMTPPLGSQRPRRQLHSSRGLKDFDGPGMNYHRRAESAPELPPFSRGNVVSQSSLPDVFENEAEEIEDAISDRPVSSGSSKAETSGIGIHVVDAADQTIESIWSGSSGLRIRSGEWDLERPSTSYGTVGSRLSWSGGERRPSSIVAETILEETSPVDAVKAVEIVPAEEEPRASSLTKSSDSSETPTLLAPHAGALSVPDGTHMLMTPDTYTTSTFSSPDFARRQGSFDTSRVGTAASSITDNRTMSSCTGDNPHRVSVDDIPSLTSSRSTMISTMHPNTSHRDFSTEHASPLTPRAVDPVVAAERRRKRASIQSLSQLVGGSFGSRSKTSEDARPHTANDGNVAKMPKREHRLKKLMFWRSKSKQSLRSALDHDR